MADSPNINSKPSVPVTAREVAECLVAEIDSHDLRRLCEKAISSFGSLAETRGRAFHRLYGLPILRPNEAHMDFSHISKERLAARFGLIIEGFEHLCEAMGFEANVTFEAQDQKGRIFGGLSAFDAIMMTDDRSLADVAWACEDLKVYATGFQLENGIPVEEIAVEVMCSNLTRLGDDGEPIYREDGKVMKGPDYVPPDCERVLRIHGLRTHTNTGPSIVQFPTPEVKSSEELEAIVEANEPIEGDVEIDPPSSERRSASDLQQGETQNG